MTLVRCTPFRDLVNIQDEMNRIFNAFFTRSPEKAEEGSLLWTPLVDIVETDEEITVMAEIPGMRKEDVKISIQDNILTLKGEKKQEKESNKKNSHRMERSYGVFEKSFSLPSSIQTDKVKASYKDGILTIHLPKAQEAKPKEIDISVN
ncbi:MAG: Hsp20/alpha crystallin family protein [bacterium]